MMSYNLVRQEERLANCVSGSRKVAGFVSTSRERGNPRISEPRIRNTSLTSLQERGVIFKEGETQDPDHLAHQPADKENDI
jgi:hypothetical protein